jgi:hypothetical protein
MKLPLRFKVGGLDFLIPKEHIGGYNKMVWEIEKANRENPPSKGEWQAGSLKTWHINLLASLDELGVMPKRFFDRPVVAGSYWFNWANLISDAKYKIGYGRPEKDGGVNYIDVDTGTPQSFFLTNWPSMVGKDF